ncbi:hypothetical protein N476_03160 [Pseudoalteromonas luteoviolacea H33]|uniref:Uncharacterized protein n=1 Tax=Pseudoalteromonas luteoviolacea H33 TaxID=1365251 RepID=A0A167B402_9GAMM|nr:hypothetical protein N476_03160 [Pseudoalteromonas luteoviolacea H33]KZN75211.1 hypothetical protein N477_20235 [Pseudoalteromonas luteoviolacea H33-S]
MHETDNAFIHLDYSFRQIYPLENENKKLKLI